MSGDQKEDESRQLSFHGGRPLGASGESKVSGPRQRGQLSSGREWGEVTAWGLSIVVDAESSSLAFCSSCR